MKNLKSLLFVLLIICFFSCSDDGNEDATLPEEPAFSATLNGATFSNFQSELATVSAESVGANLTITVTDKEMNLFRFFISDISDLDSGSVIEIGDINSEGQFTNVTIRDQANQVTYNAISGEITITNSRIDSSDEDINLVDGFFELILNNGTSSETVTANGVFENISF